MGRYDSLAFALFNLTLFGLGAFMGWAVGEVYTVREIDTFPKGVGIRLVEIVNAPRMYAGSLAPKEASWQHKWFRPVYDIQQFRDIAEKARKTGRVTVDA